MKVTLEDWRAVRRAAVAAAAPADGAGECKKGAVKRAGKRPWRTEG